MGQFDCPTGSPYPPPSPFLTQLLGIELPLQSPRAVPKEIRPSGPSWMEDCLPSLCVHSACPRGSSEDQWPETTKASLFGRGHRSPFRLLARRPPPVSQLCLDCVDGPHRVRGTCCNRNVADTSSARRATGARTVRAQGSPRRTTRPISDPCAPSSGRNQHGRRSYTEASVALSSHFALWMVAFPQKHCDPSSPMQEMAVRAGAHKLQRARPARQAHKRRCRAPLGARVQTKAHARRRR